MHFLLPAGLPEAFLMLIFLIQNHSFFEMKNDLLNPFQVPFFSSVLPEKHIKVNKLEM